MAENFVGCVVSIDCRNKLGTYQGQVSKVDKSEQTVSIVNAFRNCVLVSVPEVTISASDIRDLQIVKSAAEARQLPTLRHHSNGKSTPTTITIRPSKSETNFQLSQSVPTEMGFHSNMKRSQSFKDSPSQGQSTGTPTKENGFRKRTNSESHERGRQERVATPKKTGQSNYGKTHRDDCFNTPIDDSFFDEFDFEKNLALFDKRAIFDEIEQKKPDIFKAGESKPTKYKCDENVIESGPVEFKRIKVPASGAGCNVYVTDTGLLVPSITITLRNKLFELAAKHNYKSDRYVEVIGRSSSEMVLQLVGGSNRLVPQNTHQIPLVVILCGPHTQGAFGANCGRQLANRDVKVVLFVPNSEKLTAGLSNEIKLFGLSCGQVVTSTADLPQGPVDMIVSCVDSPDDKIQPSQPWYEDVVEWANLSKAHVLALDPPPEGSTVNTKWSLSVALPLTFNERCGKIYLCDAGFPKNIFKEAGLVYSSPFGHKFVISIHRK